MRNTNIMRFINGKIFTSDDENKYADSMIVENGRVKWIGKIADMPDIDLPVVDLEGKCVLPGFIDAHMHAGMLAEQSKQISCLPPKINSIEELINSIRNVRKKQGKDEWIQGWGYDEGKFEERRSINRYDLDKGAADVPISITRTCGHIRCVNSKALALAGIDRNTQNPPGGEIQRDSTGEPTGILIENARDLVTEIIPKMTDEELISNIVDIGRLLASQGVTTITDMGSLEGRDYYDNFIKAAQKGLKQRISIYYIWDYFCDDVDFNIKRIKSGSVDQIRIAGLKLLGDGSVSGRTAWMNKPYLGNENEFGMSVCSDELIDSAIEFCKKNRCQLSMHAMGANAIKRIIDRVYDEQPWTDNSVPFLRVEHVTDPIDESIEKAVKKGIAFVTQPNFLYAEIETYIKNLGMSWLQKTYPLKHMLEKGVHLSLSTDAPATAWATPSDPMPCIKCAVTRKAYDGTDCGQEEAIDIETAIKLYTKCGAEAAGFEKTGQLKEGYNADFIVLDRDIMTINAEDIDKIVVEKTYIQGECIYMKEKF